MCLMQLKAGDEVAKEIATAFGRYLGYGLANPGSGG